LTQAAPIADQETEKYKTIAEYLIRELRQHPNIAVDKLDADLKKSDQEKITPPKTTDILQLPDLHLINSDEIMKARNAMVDINLKGARLHIAYWIAHVLFTKTPTTGEMDDNCIGTAGNLFEEAVFYQAQTEGQLEGMSNFKFSRLPPMI
jgi:Mg2+/Co2+ transporter CorB